MIVFLMVALQTYPAVSPQDKVPTAKTPGEVRPGRSALLRSPKGMSYFLRVPRTYRKSKPPRLILFLHGSNMNGLQYLRSFEAKRWCQNDILACPNGETGTDNYGANNFTFQSAPLVVDVVRQVKAAFKTDRVYIGGHSQGGFVTYSTIMQYPEEFDGAFPMAGDCWSQNEPNLWDDRPEIMAKQKRIAIAVIHGKIDPVVSFEQGQHAYDVFKVMGYPKLRLFAPEKLGHHFMLSPVPEALAWLDAMTAGSASHALPLARKWSKQKQWGWAVQVANRILAQKRIPQRHKSRAKALLKGAERQAKKQAIAMATIMRTKKTREWLPQWYEFWHQYGHTKAAETLVKNYLKLRKAQRKDGIRLFNDALKHYRNKERDKGNAKLEELLRKAPMTYDAYYAIEWLKND